MCGKVLVAPTSSMPKKSMAASEDIKLAYGDQEAKAADKMSNSIHNKDDTNGKTEGDQKTNDTTKGQNNTYNNNQCHRSVNGSVYGGTFNFGGSQGNQTRYENSRVIYNNGTFNGNANGCFNEGGFQSHTTHYYDGSRG